MPRKKMERQARRRRIGNAKYDGEGTQTGVWMGLDAGESQVRQWFGRAELPG